MAPLLFIPGMYEDFEAEPEEQTPTPLPCGTFYRGNKGSKNFANYTLSHIESQLEETVIELGPGAHGGVAQEVMALNKQYFGLEIEGSRAQQAAQLCPGARFLHGDLTQNIEKLPSPASVISTNVLDLIVNGSAGNAYIQHLADAITTLAQPGTISVHYAQEASHLPREYFSLAMQRRGWEMSFIETPFGPDRTATRLFRYGVTRQ